MEIKIDITDYLSEEEIKKACRYAICEVIQKKCEK